MAFKVDPKKVAAKAAQEAAKAAQRGGPRTARLYWKPKQGANKLRIMPAWTDAGPNALQFWREIHVHWGVGPDEENQQHLSCPKHTPPGGEECPVCEEYERLRSSPDPAEKEAARELRPRSRAYSNIVDLDDPAWTAADISELQSQGVEKPQLPAAGDPKIQVFSYGPKILKELLDLFCDDPEICDLDEGHNIVITREGQGLQTEYRVRPEMSKTAAPCKGEPTLHDLDQVMPFREPSAMLAIMQGLDPEESSGKLPEASEDTEEEHPLPPSQEKKQAASEVADAVGEAPEDTPAEEKEEGGNPWLNADGEFEVPDGYPECFSFERDITDEVCNSQCEAFKECREAVIFRCDLQGCEVPENALEPEPKKKPKKPAKKPKKAAKKAAAPKSNGTDEEGLGTPAVDGDNTGGKKAVGGVEDLESRMKAAIDGAR